MRVAGTAIVLGFILLTTAGLALAQGQPPGPPPGLPPSPPIGPTSHEPDTNRPGGDFTSFALPQPNAELCRSACDSDGRCAAYTYVKPVQGGGGVCWLKSSVPPAQPDACCISGKR